MSKMRRTRTSLLSLSMRESQSRDRQLRRIVTALRCAGKARQGADMSVVGAKVRTALAIVVLVAGWLILDFLLYLSALAAGFAGVGIYRLIG